jgi:hypothetical protein
MAAVAIAFVATTPPQKKMTAHWRHLFFLKHRKEGDDNLLPFSL